MSKIEFSHKSPGLPKIRAEFIVREIDVEAPTDYTEVTIEELFQRRNEQYEKDFPRST